MNILCSFKKNREVVFQHSVRFRLRAGLFIFIFFIVRYEILQYFTGGARELNCGPQFLVRV